MREPEPNPKVVSSRVHLPQLDGVRGLAILLVLACHFVSFQSVRGEVVGQVIDAVAGHGFLGVDLFFVLSGFLITGILYDTRGTGHFFKYFYARRMLRICPLYYAYILAVCAALGLVLLRRGHDPLFARALGDGGWAAAYLTNVEIALKGSNVTFIFNHFWSLAVEEQFYLVWPLLVFCMTRQQLKVFCAVLILSAAGLRCLAHGSGWQAVASYLLPCRTDSLAMGALVALAARDASEWKTVSAAAGYVLVTGLAALIVCMYGAWPLRDELLYTAASLAFAGLLVKAVAAPPGTGIFAVFGSRFLGTFGKYSYGLYVVNQPIAFFPGFGKLRDWLTVHLHSRAAAGVLYAAVGIGLSFAVAFLSWHLLEKRMLRLKRHFETAPKPVPAPGASFPELGEADVLTPSSN